MSTTTAPPARTMRKEISPGMFLTRKEDARDEYAVVYTLRNDTDAAVYFTMDFWGSKNFRLLPRDANGEEMKKKKKKKKKPYKRRADLLRKVVVRAREFVEVARLKVDHEMLPSHLKVHYIWEASDATDPEMPPEVGKARTHREMIAHDVHLVTTRTDTKDGHTTFVYAIDSTARRDSLKLTLDFSESENLALRVPKKGFFARVLGGKAKSPSQVPSLVKSLHLPAKTKVKKVATVRTVVPRKGWSLRHKISVEIRELVRRPLSDVGEEEEDSFTPAGEEKRDCEHDSTDTAPRQEELLLEPEKATTTARPAKKSTRRESVMQIRSSHGFQDGFLKPPATPTPKAAAAADPDLNGWIGSNSPSTGKRESLRGSFSSTARNSLSLLLDFVKPVVTGGGKMLRPESLPPHEPTPPPYRMSWLSAEDMGDAPADTGGTSLLSIMEEAEAEKKEGQGDVPHANLFELLSSLDLACHHASFVQQAMEDLNLLKELATDSKADFRNALKEDVRIEKFGHREAILRAVLSN
jgi:hypothetical protein